MAQKNDDDETNTRDLATLFRPPVDIIARHGWDRLLQAGREQNRWILVNLQDPGEFACQTLNRDCWSDETLKELIKTSFLFWQNYVENPDGRRIVAYYTLKSFPAVFIVDPRTGENVSTINSRMPVDMIAERRFYLVGFRGYKADYFEFRCCKCHD